MKSRRLQILLLLMIGLAGLRWLSPPSVHAPVEVTPAVARPVAGALVAATSSVIMTNSVSRGGDLSAGTREIDEFEPRNAFAVMQAPQAMPGASPVPTKVITVAPFVGPLAPPPALPPQLPPPPPFQVIGSWKDNVGASVFLAGPNGVHQVSVGDVIADHRVTQITSLLIMFKHLPSNRDVTLPMPASAGSSSLSLQ